MLARTPEQIAQRIIGLLDQRNTKPGEQDMFGAISARLKNEEVSGDALKSGVDYGVEHGWFIMRGPRICRASPPTT
jgi:hypothetical protein